MNQYGSPARRRELKNALRVECVRASDARPHFLGYAGNLSETGVFIKSMNMRAPGTRVRVVLHMPGLSRRRFSSLAEVRWARGYQGKSGEPAGMGLRFLELSTGVRSMLKVFCGKKDPEGFRRLKD